MELCEALTHVYGHNNWYNPYRNLGFSIGGSKQTPYEAYQDLEEPYQKVVRSLFGKHPEKNDGIEDESRPIDFL